MEGRSKSFLVAFLSPLHSRWINFYTITATIYISQMGRQTARETCSQLSKQPTIDTAEFASRLFPHKYLQYVEQMTRIQCEPSWQSVNDMMIFTVDHLDGDRPFPDTRIRHLNKYLLYGIGGDPEHMTSSFVPYRPLSMASEETIKWQRSCNIQITCFSNGTPRRLLNSLVMLNKRITLFVIIFN